MGAMQDPKRDVPAKNHWTLVDTVVGGAAVLLPDRQHDRARRSTASTKSHQLVPNLRPGLRTAIRPAPSKSMEFTDAVSALDRIVGSILQPLSTTKAVLLPDGKVLIGQGVNRSNNCIVDGRPCTYDRERRACTSRCSTPTTGGDLAGWRGRRCRAACTAPRRCCRMARCSLPAKTAKRWYGRTIHRSR